MHAVYAALTTSVTSVTSTTSTSTRVRTRSVAAPARPLRRRVEPRAAGEAASAAAAAVRRVAVSRIKIMSTTQREEEALCAALSAIRAASIRQRERGLPHGKLLRLRCLGRVRSIGTCARALRIVGERCPLRPPGAGCVNRTCLLK